MRNHRAMAPIPPPHSGLQGANEGERESKEKHGGEQKGKKQTKGDKNNNMVNIAYMLHVHDIQHVHMHVLSMKLSACVYKEEDSKARE